MAGRAEIRCIGPSYQLEDRKAGAQRSVNLYMAQNEGIGDDRPVILRSAPGLALLVTMAGDIRGSRNADGRWFVVAGSGLYEVTTAGVTTLRGTLSTSIGFVSLVNGRDQLVVVDGANGYVFNMLTNGFAAITDPDWRGSSWVEELDGYFIFADPGTDQFYLSAIDDGSVYDALDFSSSDARPDNITTFRVHKRELFLFGTRSCEVWINSGDADFPLVRYNSTPIDVGIVGNRAAAICADALCFVGATDRGAGYVYEMRGHQPVRISTKAQEEALASSTDLSGCWMWSYHIAGNEFLGVWAPGMATVCVFDFSTRQWHERAEVENGEWVPMRNEFVSFVSGGHYALGGAGIYRMADDLYTIDGDPLVRERTWPHLMAPSMEPIAYRGLELACTTGGPTAGNITLSISNDGGNTWGAPLLRSLGAIGRHMQPVRWLMLGAAVNRVFRLRCSDPVALSIHAAAVDA